MFLLHFGSKFNTCRLTLNTRFYGTVKRKENSTTSLSQLMDDGDYLMAARLSKDYPIKKLTGYKDLE
jgi:hypothetical protein